MLTQSLIPLQAQAMYAGYGDMSAYMDPAAYGAFPAPYADPSSGYAAYGDPFAVPSSNAGYSALSEAGYQRNSVPQRRAPPPAPPPETQPEKPKLEPPTVNVKVLFCPTTYMDNAVPSLLETRRAEYILFGGGGGRRFRKVNVHAR
jgi:hypothetical protein